MKVLAVLAVLFGVSEIKPTAPIPQLTANTRFEPEQLHEDLGMLRRAYTQLHPGLHRYLTPPNSCSARSSGPS